LLVYQGELVGKHSFATLEKVTTEYGEGGPSQGLLNKEGALEIVTKKFPNIDYVLSCQVADEAGTTAA
jgi:hypothetical protein